MKFSFKIFGKKADKNSTSLDNQVEDIINSIDERPFAVSDSNVMFAGFGELGGYHFIQTIIVGDFKIKTLKGAKLHIDMTDFELILDSDSTELASDYSDVSGRYITRIDFQIEESDLKKIESVKPKGIKLSTAKATAEFKIFNAEKSSN